MFLYIEYLNDIFIIKLNYSKSFLKDIKNKYLKYNQFLSNFFQIKVFLMNFILHLFNENIIHFL